MSTGRIEYVEQLKIPSESTCILLCGVSNSGKSTFAKKWFDHNNVVSSDEILLELLELYPSFSFMNYSAIQNEAFDTFWDTIFSKAGSNFLVIDTMCVNYAYRKELIDFTRNFFKNIILIVFDIKLEEIMSRPKKDYGRNLPVTYSQEDIPANHADLVRQLNSTMIFDGVDIVYFLNSDTIDKVSIEFD